jgi:hypothetical protein
LVERPHGTQISDRFDGVPDLIGLARHDFLVLLGASLAQDAQQFQSQRAQGRQNDFLGRLAPSRAAR